jgi:hypothetical protein
VISAISAVANAILSDVLPEARAQKVSTNNPLKITSIPTSHHRESLNVGLISPVAMAVEFRTLDTRRATAETV